MSASDAKAIREFSKNVTKEFQRIIVYINDISAVVYQLAERLHELEEYVAEQGAVGGPQPGVGGAEEADGPPSG